MRLQVDQIVEISSKPIVCYRMWPDNARVFHTVQYAEAIAAIYEQKVAPSREGCPIRTVHSVVLFLAHSAAHSLYAIRRILLLQANPRLMLSVTLRSKL
jgi:hypothetical protein